MTALETLFGTAPHLTAWQECARAVLIFAYGLLLMRVSGRRTFGKWSALDIVVSIMLGSSLSRALTGNAPLLGTMAASAVLVLLHGLLAQAAARSTRLARIIEGTAITLSRDGRLDERARLHQSVSAADLAEALRQTGVADVGETAGIILEPSGKITVRKPG
ncbi:MULTISPECIES: DUF421 domain-containing protein [unclassified Methylobacterium]|jgi:uncharacterized membrane protein YcaP (DUF421 family)|uniref:DUF421 domain-containing protein n=1 Tax=unclassified Methylobacterium TaxID=2615210 RepID=UPI00135280F3|nr:YetF domain-containing protein [Methylobacterium sp. 2A]MWV21941.1 DUF421 domain-containing protein [Methylobacterium sp. 2A]